MTAWRKPARKPGRRCCGPTPRCSSISTGPSRPTRRIRTASRSRRDCPTLLARLRERLAGALAIVTGRSLDALDALARPAALCRRGPARPRMAARDRQDAPFRKSRGRKAHPRAPSSSDSAATRGSSSRTRARASRCTGGARRSARRNASPSCARPSRRRTSRSCAATPWWKRARAACTRAPRSREFSRHPPFAGRQPGLRRRRPHGRGRLPRRARRGRARREGRPRAHARRATASRRSTPCTAWLAAQPHGARSEGGAMTPRRLARPRRHRATASSPR